MRGISTFNLLLKGSLFAAALTAGSFTTFGQVVTPTTPITAPCVQSTICEPTDITFDLPDGGGFLFGFSGDFNLIAAQGPNASSDFELRSTDLGAGLTTKVLYSPRFSSAGSTTGIIRYSFDISGTANLAGYRIYLEDASGTLHPICAGTEMLSSARTTTICGQIENLPSQLTVEGATFRFVLAFDLSGQPAHFMDFDNFGSNIFEEGRIILPVNFMGVTARKATKGTEVTWKVADEINVSRYEVQKGTNAGDLKTIGVVFAGEKSAYSFIDEQPSQGVSFYRIRSVDVDGKFKFSTVISFSNGKSAAILRAYPMPARDQVTLQHGAIEGKAQITISSEDGRIVKRQVLAVGSMLTPIDLSSLKVGLYLLRLENSNGEVETLKLVKQ